MLQYKFAPPPPPPHPDFNNFYNFKFNIERGRWKNQKLNTAIDYVPCVNKEILKMNTMF